MPRPTMTAEEMLAVRHYKKWTQARLADFLGCSEKTVRNYENGYSAIPRGVQFRLDNILQAVVAESKAAVNA